MSGLKDKIQQAMEGLVKQTSNNEETTNEETNGQFQNNQTPQNDVTKDENKENSTDEKLTDEKTIKEENKEEKSIEKDQEKKIPKYVPYERFKKVIEKKNKLQQELEELKKAQRKLEIDPEDEEVLQQLKEMGFVSKDELDKYIKEMELQKIQEEEVREFENYLNHLENYFSQFGDDFPKFDKEKVLEFGFKNQIYDPQAAFIVMHLGEIIDYYVKQEINKLKAVPSYSKKEKEEMKIEKEKLSFKDGSLRDAILKFLNARQS